MATEKLIAGAVANYIALMTTELNSLASGSAVQGTTIVTNGGSLDLTGEFSFTTGTSLTGSGNGPYVGLYLYPLNGDGTTYGDGRFASQTAAQPPANYNRGYCGIPATAQTQTGTFAIPGTSIFQIPFPRGSFIPVLYNFTGATFPASGVILYYRTTNISVS